MRGARFWIAIEAAASLACAASNGSETKVADPACEKRCDEAYQTCAETCREEIDNTMCAQECIDVLRSCTDACGR